jgi:uncharacterized protein (TIRG00374 family)
LLTFLFKQVDAKSLLGIIKNANAGLLSLAFIIFFFNYIFCFLRWEMLLKTIKIHLSVKRVLISFAGGVFFSLFLPSTIGGDLVRSMDLAAHTNRPREVVATVFLDRLSGYVGLVTLALLALLFGWKLVIEDKSVLISLITIIGLLTAILAVLFNKFLYSKINNLLSSPTAGRIRKAIRNLHHEIHIFRWHKRIILNNIILSVFVQGITPLVFYIVALSLGIKINIVYFFIFLPLIGAISLLPISIGGLGLRDATTIFFFAKVGVSKDFAFAMSLLNFSFIVAYASLGGLIYVLTVHHRRLQCHQSPSLPTAQ